MSQNREDFEARESEIEEASAQGDQYLRPERNLGLFPIFFWHGTPPSRLSTRNDLSINKTDWIMLLQCRQRDQFAACLVSLLTTLPSTK